MDSVTIHGKTDLLSALRESADFATYKSMELSEIIGKRIESIKSATGNSVIDKSLDFLQELSDTADILSEYNSSIRHLRQKRI
jgi:hypothetical protein